MNVTDREFIIFLKIKKSVPNTGFRYLVQFFVNLKKIRLFLKKHLTKENLWSIICKVICFTAKNAGCCYV